MNAETFLQILLPIWRSSLPSNIPPGYLDGFVARKRDDILRTLQPAVDLLNEQRRKKAEREEQERVERAEAERAEAERAEAQRIADASSRELPQPVPTQHTLASTGLQPLGPPSKKILDTITAGLTHPADEGKSSRKIDRAPGAYMAVYVERIGDDRYSVAHYFTQNGDRVADPDIEFERENGEWYPAAAQMAVGTYHRAFEHEDDGRILYRPKTYRSIAQLANVLLRNIKAQQDIVIGESFDEAPPLPVVPSVVETPPLPSPLPPPPQTPTGLFRLIRQKDGGWNAQLTDRVSKPDFIRLLKISSALRGNYSSTRPAGFRFQAESDARSFISQIDEIPDALIPVYNPPKSGLLPGWTDDPATLDRVRKLVEASERLNMKLPKQAAWLAKVMDPRQVQER